MSQMAEQYGRMYPDRKLFISGKDRRMTPATEAMADTIGANAINIPIGFRKVAGYVTGPNDVLWTKGEFQRFATSGIVRIDQSASLSQYQINDADVADVESAGAGGPAFVSATQKRFEYGLRGCAYVNMNNLPGLVTSIQMAGLDISKIDFWLANWNLDLPQAAAMIGKWMLQDNTHRVINVVAVQWASPESNPNTILPGTNRTLKAMNVDLSETAIDWTPVAPVIPSPSQTYTGIVVSDTLQVWKVTSADQGRTWWHV